jgi:CBS domain-containing protein
LKHKALTWKDFNSNFHSSSRHICEIEEIAQANMDKLIDLRPYMIEKPYCVYEGDKIQKVVEIFRLMNLRHLPVVNENDNTLVGIITRQDIFAYMSL